jgi:hypothetical protein
MILLSVLYSSYFDATILWIVKWDQRNLARIAFFSNLHLPSAPFNVFLGNGLSIRRLQHGQSNTSTNSVTVGCGSNIANSFSVAPQDFSMIKQRVCRSKRYQNTGHPSSQSTNFFRLGLLCQHVLTTNEASLLFEITSEGQAGFVYCICGVYIMAVIAVSFFLLRVFIQM